MMAKLGEWFWYVGSDESDDEMMQSGKSRDGAIADGRHWFGARETFYIVEARMRVSDEAAIASRKRDAAPFAETRNGEWIEPLPATEGEG
jgi:hypothetical protein